jgi:hypothetical protein
MFFRKLNRRIISHLSAYEEFAKPGPFIDLLWIGVFDLTGMAPVLWSGRFILWPRFRKKGENTITFYAD